MGNFSNIERQAEEILRKILPLDDPEKAKVIMRAIRATGDLDLIGTLRFSQNAISLGKRLVKGGVIVDTKMARTGLGDLAIYREPKTRRNNYYSIDLIEEMGKEMDGKVVMIGTSPLALLTLNEMIKREEVKPAVVIGVPVGFVNALKAKIELTKLPVEFITNISVKGGVALGISLVKALVELGEL
ncbi:MAG: precorrin-8X methylmutase [Candidatus Aramenus sulfurataquae]|uniref:Precorrin-8X methylmutase n=2 Tax=Candidatus Aramenus sulfurataquae TaxID=1326980 RepID=W7KLE5_9CREN|nr:MAG: precorrin-8X methylmutase [Candidatus Aramenus sulfurataquae]MCL7342971.1 precorrin-8X methylmutase [Candidatus Aramenus sulfurataquae]